MKKQDLEFYMDFLAMTSSEEAFNVEYEMGDLVVTDKGLVEINPNISVDKKYTEALAKASNDDQDKILFKKAYDKQQKEFEKEMVLYNKALKKQKDKKERIEKKRKETGLKLV